MTTFSTFLSVQQFKTNTSIDDEVCNYSNVSVCPSWRKFATSQSSAFNDKEVALGWSRGEVGIILQ